LTPPRLACRDLTLEIAGRTLCQHFAFDAAAGECWAVVGPNGAGKTTLVATLAGLRAPNAGTIAYEGAPLTALSPRERALRRGFLPQDSADFFAATVLESVLVGRHPHLGRWHWESAADFDCARAALAALDLAGFEARDVRTLSGGERRRVALAALVAQDPPLWLLDEPASHLDLGQQVDALGLLAGFARARGRTMVMVVHELHLALRYADHAIAIGGGRAVAGAAREILTADALSALFGHQLVAVGDGPMRTFIPA
jgi:iron complex transport system ATP-binding protein